VRALFVDALRRGRLPLWNPYEGTGKPLFAGAEAALLAPSLNVERRVETVEPYGAFNSTRLWALGDALGPRWARAFRRFGLTHVAFQASSDVTQREARALSTAGATLVLRDEASGHELWRCRTVHGPSSPGRRCRSRGRSGRSRRLLALVERGDDVTVAVEAGAAQRDPRAACSGPCGRPSRSSSKRSPPPIDARRRTLGWPLTQAGHLLSSKRAVDVQGAMHPAGKRKQSLYFPEDVFQEIQAEAQRQDRSLSWIVQQAWRIAREQLAQAPGINDVARTGT
jgi:uncharacterized small protein (TIGR04563 family)